MSIGIIERARELAGGVGTDPELAGDLRAWEDILVLLVDPESPKVLERTRKRKLLSFLLEQQGIDEDEFWRLPRGQRGRLFLARFSRVSRSIPELELTAFDLDKLAKERFRHEPLTLGAAWHFGFWRTYFSHAAITHPANDGLREEFSTAWDLSRKRPAVLFRQLDGARLAPLRSIRIDMPMLVGPLPHSDGHRMETAFLRAIEKCDSAKLEKRRSLVVVEKERLVAHAEHYLPHAPWVLPRLDAEAARRFDEDETLARFVDDVRIIELAYHEELADTIERMRATRPALLFSVLLRYDGSDEESGAFWNALERAAATDGVALLHLDAGPVKSYRWLPRVDAYLKKRALRASVQIVSAGGDSDTQASAATVYEAVLLGANGGAMSHTASLALVPELVDAYHGRDAAAILARALECTDDELESRAAGTLSCWQHSILDFLSCMGIDDIQKTSGNRMAITITEDWRREVDGLATRAFAEVNVTRNRERLSQEPVPKAVRERFRVSALLEELRPDQPLALAARVLAQESASWHLANTNKSLTADFLEVIYRMAAGETPRLDDFLLAGDLGPGSTDEIGVRLSRESIAWSLERLARDPARLDYLSLAIPRGFRRGGAAAPAVELALHAEGVAEPLHHFRADDEGGFLERFDGECPDSGALWLEYHDPEEDEESAAPVRLELVREGHAANGRSVIAASPDGRARLHRDPDGGLRLAGMGIRRPIWHGPVSHASISLGAASEEFLTARIEGNAGLAFTSSGEGGPIRLADDEAMSWETLQVASGHFGLTGADLRRVRDVEIKINQGAKPGKGGRLSGAKVTPRVSRARHIPIGIDALSPDPKHDIYSIEDMPAEVWLWLGYHNHCGIKITGSNYTRYVAAGMWSNFVVDYLLIDSGMGGSGNYHADSSHVGWPDIFRTILHTHHALMNEMVELPGEVGLRPIRDDNGAPFGATGSTRLFASGGVRSELDMLKVLIAGADGVVEASIGKAVAFGCNQCGNCHLDCPRGGITTKPELTLQNDPATMRARFRNWTVWNMVKLAVFLDAFNRESGALADDGRVAKPELLLTDIRELRGRVDLLAFPPAEGAPPEPQPMDERDSCRVGSLTVSERVSIHAIWEAARTSHNGGNNRGGGIDFAGFTPEAVRERTCLILNTLGPDREDTLRAMVSHLGGCRLFDCRGDELEWSWLLENPAAFRMPVRREFQGEDGWRRAGLREAVGDYTMLFVEARDEVLVRYGHQLIGSAHWLQRETKYGELPGSALSLALSAGADAAARQHVLELEDAGRGEQPLDAWRTLLEAFLVDVREEYFSALAHLLDTRYYRADVPSGAPAGKVSGQRRGYVVSMGEDLGAIKICGWTHTIPEYFDCDSFWCGYPGADPVRGVPIRVKGSERYTRALVANVWGMHHRYPTNSPALDAEGRGNPAGAHPFKAYNVLLKHNGEQVAVDSTAPFLCEYGYVHADESMGEGWHEYQGDSIYERKALTDTEYAAYLVDFTRRVLGLSTEEASQVISPITGIDLEAMEDGRREKLRLLMENYVRLTPTGPYKFTIVESLKRDGERIVGFRENMDIKFLRPHEIVSHKDLSPGGAEAVANGSEAKIADSMLRVLHSQGVLKDAAADLRFNMRQGGQPGHEEHGGVFEAFVVESQADLRLVNRFDEVVPVKRAGTRVDLSTPLEQVRRLVDYQWAERVDEWIEELAREAKEAESTEGRLFGPEEPLPAPLEALLNEVQQRGAELGFHDLRYLLEDALPSAAERSDALRALSIRALTELRKRLAFGDLGQKALSSVEYLCDGGRDEAGRPEGGLYRIFDAVPALVDGWGRSTHVRLDAATRDDLVAPHDARRDVLVVDLSGFESESFTSISASRFLADCVRLGWRHFLTYDARGGPRYVGSNFADAGGAPATDVVMEAYGRENGDFFGALLEGGRFYLYGQAQSHTGFKAAEGHIFVLNDALNTCLYAAHGGTLSVWDTGSRFAVAGQNRVYLEDGETLAGGMRSIHFGAPNEYAFEYLMSGGPNSLHVVLGLKKPDASGELSLRPKPYAGKFLMSGAAAGRVVLFDPDQNLDPKQHLGNRREELSQDEWNEEVGPFVEEESRRRGLPLRVQGENISLRLEGRWRSWHYSRAFVKLVP